MTTHVQSVQSKRDSGNLPIHTHEDLYRINCKTMHSVHGLVMGGGL